MGQESSTRSEPMKSFRWHLRRRLSGATPLGLFPLATLCLAGWLGYQAIDAAASHRRAAESVLTNYALISATEYAGISQSKLDELLDEVFRPVRWTARGTALPSAAVLGSGLRAAAANEGCACPGLLAPIALIRFDPDTQEVEVLPDTLPAPLREHLEELVLSRSPTDERLALGILTTRGGGILEESVAVGYMVAAGTADSAGAVYAFVLSAEALGDLLGGWFAVRRLLPPPITGGWLNDSLLVASIRDAEGTTFFASTSAHPAWGGAQDTLGARFGGLIVHASVRPSAAAQLVVGGLPDSRLPLLAVMMAVTLGLGLVAFVQLRRERRFQHVRDDFVSGVTHELRTSLTQIRMFAELQETQKLPSEEDRRRAVRVIHRESMRLNHLVENILQFSRFRRADGHRMQWEQLDLAAAVEDIVEMFGPLLEAKGVHLDFVAERGLPVLANRDALIRIMMNLLDNAAKYGPRGQTIRVRVRRVADVVRVSVADQGPGIPHADRGRIWEAYRRLERDIEANVPGTGIGLSVVHELAGMYDWRVWVEDADGVGALFVLELPLVRSTASEPVLAGAAT